MYERKNEKVLLCPLEYGLDLFGGKWNSRVLCVLGTNGPMRYSALHRELDNVTDAVLNNVLKEMSADGMVIRTVYDEQPLRVEYSLSEKAESALPILQSICAWSRNFTSIEREKALAPCRTCGQLV